MKRTLLLPVLSLVIVLIAQRLPGDTHYVSPTGGNTPPYNSWANAARVIQDAVDAADSGDLVLVTNGLYATGGAVTPGYDLSNRVVVTTNINIESVNGPEVTIILGESCNGTNGRWAVRCVYMSRSAWLVGFTLSNGYTRVQGDYSEEQTGGGAHCTYGCTISNCIISGNSADEMGGGVYCIQGCTTLCSTVSGNVAKYGGGAHFSYKSTVEYCLISGNVASNNGGGVYCLNAAFGHCTIDGNMALYGGGVASSGGTVEHCVISSNNATLQGGGVHTRYSTTVKDCVITDNASKYGGGVHVSPADIINCLIYGNKAYVYGGGGRVHEGSTLQNCTIVSNASDGTGGGVYCRYEVTNINCIIYFNTAGSSGTNYYNYGSGAYYTYCCTFPTVTGSFNGAGNITNDPALLNYAAGDCHLSDISPCIDAGTNMAWMTGATDLDGNPRIYDGTVDMGCYEFIPEPGIILFEICCLRFVIYHLLRRSGRSRRHDATLA